MATFGPLDVPATGESEFAGDGKYGWEKSDDLGRSKGRVLSGGEEAALLRREAHEAMERTYGPSTT